MRIEPETDRWYALQLRTRWECSAANLLTAKGYQTYLPTRKTTKERAGLPKVAPLFPGYVFCRFNPNNRLPVLVTPGVIAVVGRGKVPIPIEDSELEAIQKVVSAGLPLEPCPYLEVGQRIRIEDGALSGIEGILTGFKGTHRLVISVSLLRRSVALEIDREIVGPVRTASRAVEGFSILPAMAGSSV